MQLNADLDMANEDINNLRNSLDVAVRGYSRLLPDEQIVADIKRFSGVACAVGQKTSRAINKICQKFSLDKHPEYNARFALLADSLNPLQVKRTALLSVHPCDFLEMSNEANSWSSCHCIRNGEYHGGTLSYMNDGVSMIFYTVDDNVTEDFYKASKRTRQVFCYGDGILLQSRLYPQTDDEESRSIYRDIVQRTISMCLDVPNLWTLKRVQESVNTYCQTHEDALHYPDYSYDYFKPNISLLKSIDFENRNSIVIGSTAYCLDCAAELTSHDSLFCDGCNDDRYVTCYDCESRINIDDAHYIHGEYYCDECSSYCDHCETYTCDEMTGVCNSYGNWVYVCESCRDEYFYYCEDCGEYFCNEKGVSLDDGFHCNKCLEDKYYLCEYCSEYVYCANAVKIEEKMYCADCADDIQVESENIESECLITA